MLLTATPIADSPVDVILLLNLLVPNDEAILLYTDADVTKVKSSTGNLLPDWPATKQNIESNFIERYLDENNNLTNEFKRKFGDLAGGRISYF